MSHAKPQPRYDVSVMLTGDRAQIDQVEGDIIARLEQFAYAKASRFAVKLSVEEAVANAFNHGHKNLPPGVPVRLEYAVAPDEVRIAVEDQGPGFVPADVPDPTMDENIEQPSGRGIMLIRAYMTRVAFSGSGNRIEMTYKKPAPKA
ncbi:MAG: ATP-binding protein [Phycisphaerae bacterium]|nr:ATP-binding protein [Phycisphaerae bacterium]